MEDLYFAYEQFCNIQKEKTKAKTEFKKYLEQRGLIHCKIRRKTTENPRSAFQGIKLTGKYKEELIYG